MPRSVMLIRPIVQLFSKLLKDAAANPGLYDLVVTENDIHALEHVVAASKILLGLTTESWP